MKRWRPIISLSVIGATVTVFVFYFAEHPAVGHQLRQIPLGLLGLLIGLYVLSIIALAWVTVATLRLCQLPLSPSESFLITAYSAVINFFGPLQSGPAFRGAYLKKKYGLNLKKFAGASLVYLFFWGFYSVIMLLSGLLKWWLIAMVAVLLFAVWLLLQIAAVKERLAGLVLRWWLYLALATLAQIIVVSVIYFCELRSVAPGTSYMQAVVYTGAANLALYVSLTPGAIGFRESFLVLSRHLHHINDSSIVAASVLDRAVYVVMLLILATFIFGTHASRKLQAIK